MGHGLDQGNSETLVLGQHHQHVGGGVAGGQLAGADARDELDRSGEAQVGHVAPERRPVVRFGSRSHDGQMGTRRGSGPGHEERGDRVLMGLVGGESPYGQPPRASSDCPALQRSNSGRIRRDKRKPDIGHGNHQRRGTAGCPQLAGIELGHPDPEHGPRGESGQLLDGCFLGPGDPVVPGGEEPGRGDAVVVQHQSLGTVFEPAHHVRPGGHLIDEDVSGHGISFVLPVGPGLVCGLGIRHVDVDPGGDPCGQQLVAEDPGVLPHRVSTVEHRHEQVDPRPVASATRRLWGAGVHHEPFRVTMACTDPCAARCTSTSAMPRWAKTTAHVSGWNGRPGRRSRATRSIAASHAS